jgi:hypothetical protein
MSERDELVDDLADVLSHMVIGWEPVIGHDLAQHPEVQRVMKRYRDSKANPMDEAARLWSGDDLVNWLRHGDCDDTDEGGVHLCANRRDAAAGLIEQLRAEMAKPVPQPNSQGMTPWESGYAARCAELYEALK